MTEHRFQQGQSVSWKDASGQRYRGRVVQYQPSHVDESTGAARAEGVMVVVDGTSHVSIVPPAALTTEESRAGWGARAQSNEATKAGRKPPA